MAQQRTPQVNESGMDHEALAAAAHGGAPGRPPAGAAGGPPSRDDAEVNESGIDQEAVAAADAALEEPDDADGVAEGMSGLRDDG